jgi:RNA polymerase sigma-70 factor (ECF subfamily)
MELDDDRGRRANAGARPARSARSGRYQLEAALQSAHVHRRHTGQANWEAVVQLYDALWVLTGSPVVAMNRALAVAELQGAAPPWPRWKRWRRTHASL